MTQTSSFKGMAGSARLDLLVSLLLIAAAIALPFMIDSRYVLGQIVLALFYATIASQWNLLFGFAGVFSLAQMAMFAFGGYATAMICFYFGWNVWTALLPGALSAVVFSLIVGLACLRLTGVYVALLTLAIAQTMYLLIVTDTECFTMVGSICRQFTGGAVGFARFGDLGTRALLKGQWLVGNYAIVATLFAITMIVTYIIVKSPIGLAFRALKDNPGYAVARGVNRFQAQLLVFGISAFFTGLAGGFYAAHFQAIGPGILSMSQLMFIIAITVVGGVGTFWGPLVGTIVLVAADELMREAGEFRTLGLGLIIALSILLMPKGLVGRLGDLVFWLRHRNAAAVSSVNFQEKPATAGK
ncbi:inner-membrane translocator [Shinella sp. SUS2]|uniref:branched-chain amino acid ABC transporter permease n=1 Tax=unclassified Shinella TaxID=2643062 RepID=UPI00068348BD|nr:MULTISPECIES: branched-chain amino acid ABC transporter permease [unclassified Shinella]KNY14182.1 inner-membrane translocator [Shinella sp. SUS2]KOC74006.1 inner-membrane translocator [Shinella sp. GWS1]MDG4675404.1 branched-chain amino acid ABC transporter permease [Shinella sp. 838]